MKNRKLVWSPTKFYEIGCKSYRISINVSLDDYCNNKVCDFSITGDVYKKRKNGSWEHCMGGCIHEEIVKHYPELKKFIPLHLSNYLGQPMYPEANGAYHIRKSSKEVAMSYLRCTEQELSALSFASNEIERPYFKYLLFSLGLVAKWKKEADEFIAFLEEKTGNEWVNPYKPEEGRFVMRLSDEEKIEIESKIAINFYTYESIKSREEERKRQINEKKRNEVITDYEKAVLKAKEVRDVKLYIFDNGMPLDNMIYYDHTKKVVFNRLDFGEKVSQERFDEFVSKIDYSKLPEGIRFYYGKENDKE